MKNPMADSKTNLGILLFAPKKLPYCLSRSFRKSPSIPNLKTLIETYKTPEKILKTTFKSDFGSKLNIMQAFENHTKTGSMDFLTF